MKNMFILLSIICGAMIAKAQPLTLNRVESSMQIQGTSSLHDWESIVEDYEVEADLAQDRIKNIRFSAAVRSIKSGKSSMDKNTYKALNESSYPEIRFKANQLDIQGDQLVGEGQLTIAGKSRNIQINLATAQEASEVSVNGSIKIKMIDYDITPPTAVFGTIKTGDDIAIQFDFVLIKI